MVKYQRGKMARTDVNLSTSGNANCAHEKICFSKDTFTTQKDININTQKLKKSNEPVCVELSIYVGKHFSSRLNDWTMARITVRKR